MPTLVYLLSYNWCLSGPDVPQVFANCAWLDVDGDGFTDLRDWSIIQNDAPCIFATCTVRPEALIEEECP